MPSTRAYVIIIRTHTGYQDIRGGMIPIVYSHLCNDGSLGKITENIALVENQAPNAVMQKKELATIR